MPGKLNSHPRTALRVLVLLSVLAVAGVAVLLFSDGSGGLSAAALAHSVARETGGSTLLGVRPCRHDRSRTEWRCQVADGDSGGGIYVVEMKDARCWSARAVDPTQRLSPRAKGCIGIGSELRVLDRLFD
jgi:hypothetical protein